MPTEVNVCFDLYTAYPIRDYLVGISGGVGIGGVVLGMIYFLSAVITIFWIRKQQHNARQGMEGAALHVIFPIYLPFLWCSALSDVLVGLVVLFCDINFRKSNSWDNSVMVAVAFALQHFVIEGTAFVLMQYGCGWRAVKNAAKWAVGWAIASFFVQFMLYYDGSTDVSFFANIFWNILQLLFYGTLWFAPETKLFRRGAVIYYSRFWTILRMCVIVQDILFRYGTTQMEITASNCIYAIMVLPVFIIFKPIVVYKSLLYDSIWWQGISQGSMLSTVSPSSTSRPGGIGRRSEASFFTKLYLSLFGEQSMPLTQQSLSRSQSGASNKYSHSSGGLFLSGNSHNNSQASSSYRLLSEHDGDEESAERESSNSLQQDDSLQNSALLVEQQQLRSPLNGIEVGFSEAQALAKEVDHIRKEGTVRLLNFAYLTVDRENAPPSAADTNPSQRSSNGSRKSGGSGNNNSNSTMPSVGSVTGLLGTGSFSKVYAGWYKHNRVAIKMLFTQDLNPDIIRRYSNEARILSELSDHPNVVKIYGVAVLPPSVCIVLEICEFGSLSDVLRGCQQLNSQRAPLLLTMADRMYLALGCARGLAALHNYAPDLCHRDIKSMNFLIDRHLNAKIADLDLGVEYARRYADKKRGTIADSDSDNSFGHRMSSTDSFSGHHMHALGHAAGTSATSSISSYIFGRLQGKNQPPPRQNHPFYPVGGASQSRRQQQQASHGGFQQSKKFGRSHGMNITWQAPEALLGITYTQKSDVYSLGLVLWEIIASGRSVKKYSMTTSNSSSTANTITATSVAYASIPFSECNSQNEICERVLKGFRPSIAPFLPPEHLKPNTNSSNSHHHPHIAKNGSMLVDPEYLDILQKCWDMDPHHRPNSRDVEHTLQVIWQHCVHRIIRTTNHGVDKTVLAQEHAKVAREIAELQQQQQQLISSSQKRFRTQRIRLSPPSPALMTTLDALRRDLRWHDLDTDHDSPSQMMGNSEGCYLVVTPTYQPSSNAPSSFFSQSIASGLQEFRRFFTSPNHSQQAIIDPQQSGTQIAYEPAPYHCIVWATRKWLHRMGFLMHDILAMDILQVLKGIHTDETGLRSLLRAAADPSTARTQTHHIVTRLCRRDGREVTLSIHAYPIFQPVQIAPPATTTTTTTTTTNNNIKTAQQHFPPNNRLVSMDMSLNSLEDTDFLMDDGSVSGSARSSLSSTLQNLTSSVFNPVNNSNSHSNSNSSTPNMFVQMTSGRSSSRPGSISEPVVFTQPLPLSVVYQPNNATDMLLPTSNSRSSSFSQMMKVPADNKIPSDIKVHADNTSTTTTSQSNTAVIETPALAYPKRGRMPSSTLKSLEFSSILEDKEFDAEVEENFALLQSNNGVDDNQAAVNTTVDDSAVDLAEDEFLDDGDEDDDIDEEEEDAIRREDEEMERLMNNGLEHTERQRVLTAEALLVSASKLKRRKRRQLRLDRKQKRQDMKAQQFQTPNNNYGETWLDVPSVSATPAMGITNTAVKGATRTVSTTSVTNEMFIRLTANEDISLLDHEQSNEHAVSHPNNAQKITEDVPVSSDLSYHAASPSIAASLLSSSPTISSISEASSPMPLLPRSTVTGGSSSQFPAAPFLSNTGTNNNFTNNKSTNINNSTKNNATTNTGNLTMADKTTGHSQQHAQVAFIVLQFSAILGEPNKH